MRKSGSAGGPLISVILPTYKRHALLPRSIESVLTQTISDWELLVVDDEPDPRTKDIVDSFGDDRISCLQHSHNRGLSAARNTGIREAQGEFVAFLDDDDEYLSSKLERQIAILLADHDIGVVSCFEEVLRVDGSTVQRCLSLEADVYNRLLMNDLVRMQLLTVRRACFDRVGLFDERLKHHEDYDMTLRLSRAFRFATVPEPLIRIIETPGSLSVNTHNRISALQIIMQTHPEFREIRRVRGRWERRLARHYAEVGDNSAWRHHMVQSLLANPLGVSTWVTFAAGLLFGPAAHTRLGEARGRNERSRRLSALYRAESRHK